MFEFRDRKTVNDVGKYIRHICDRTAPNNGADNGRKDNRHNRSIPTLLCPFVDRTPVVGNCATVITKDFSNRGVGLLLHQPLREERFILGYYLDAGDPSQPWFFTSVIRTTHPIGGGYWIAGAEFSEFLNDSHADVLDDLKSPAAKLLPPAWADPSVDLR
ncbi:MAG: hypothetical protein ACE5KM_06135 [Planctomycetaceae bacterium]